MTRLSELLALEGQDPDLSPDQIRGIEHEISDRLKTDVEVGRVMKSGDVFVAFYTYFDADENEVNGSMKFKAEFDDWKLERFEVITEAGRVFQTGYRYPPRNPGDGVERARAFDRVNKRTGDRPDRSWFPVDEKYTAIDGSNEGDYIQVLVMKNTGVNDYYGINVLFMSDGTVDKSTADSTSDEQWREDKEEIIKTAREWFGGAKIRAFVARGGDAEINEAGRVFQVGDRPAPRTGPADHEKARAFDKPGTNRSVLFHAGKGKWVGVEYATEENEDGEEEIQILMMRDDIEPYQGKHPYYGINVAFKRDGTVFGFAAQGDPIASKQWSREKHAIIAAAKKALDDPSLPGMYDGLGGVSVKRGKGKLPFDVTDHKLVDDDKPVDRPARGTGDYHGYHDSKANEGKITFKQFMLGEAAPKTIKVKEPGWYVVDHMDKAVEGPMSESGARAAADEMNAGKTGGDIPPFDVLYFTDYEIRRMNEK